MKKLFLFLVYIFTTINLAKAQCDLSFEFVNTGTNMTVFFTPPAASSIHDELGDGTIGSFYVDSDGSFICAASVAFNGSQIQLAVMADDSTSPEKDGFSSGESINWFYETTDGNIFAITPSPNDNFTINGISFIQSASITEIDCGGGDDSVNGDQCPPLDFDFVNTGSNMTLFITPPGASALASLGNGTIGVYYIDNGGQQLCGGASAFSGSQFQITAMADDSTSPEKDGFSAGETIVWKFEDNNGNQYNLTPSPQDGFALNGISFISGISYDEISCAVDVEGCTDANYFEYSSNATIDDGSCLTLIFEGCTDEFADNYNSNANLDDGSCFTSIPGCTDISACNYDSTANTDDGSCYNNDLGCGCDSPAAADGYDCDGVCIVDTDGDGVCNQFEIVGCQDPTAANYDPNATDSPSIVGDNCPPLDFNFTNTGSNMTLFVTPSGASALASLGDGTIGVYYIDDNGQQSCGGASAFSGSQVQITAMADDSTSPEKDGFSVGETIVWKFEDNNGNQYILTPSPQDGFALNGISFISGISYDAISCAVDVEGCTDANYFEYSSNATIDDGSCLTLIFEGCTDEFADNYNSNANLDDGSCFTSIPGCTDISACNYDSTANTDDGSCYNNDLGCGCDSPAAADGYDCDGVCIVDTDGDGVCNQFEIVGCQDPTAANYDPNATDSPSIVGDNCPPLDFNFTNTGSNMTLFVTPSGASALASLGDGTIGVYYIDDNGQQSCGGASAFSGSQVQITAMADDSTSPEKDGFSVGETIVWKFEDNNGNQYILTPSPQDGFALNGISFISGIQSELISCGSGDEVSCEYLGCTNPSYFEYDSGATIDDGSCLTLIIEGCTDSNYVEYDQNANIDDGSCLILSVNGCTDETACNYNPNATSDNGSCYNNDLGCGCDTPAADDGYNCDGTCLDDIDSDGVCDEFEVVGCQDLSAANYNSNATDSGYCDYLGCTNAAYLEFDATATIDNGSCITLIVSGCTDTNAENYNPDANTSDGSCEYDLIGLGCQVSFETYNSGTNHTVMIPGSISTPLSSLF